MTEGTDGLSPLRQARSRAVGSGQRCVAWSPNAHLQLVSEGSRMRVLKPRPTLFQKQPRGIRPGALHVSAEWGRRQDKTTAGCVSQEVEPSRLWWGQASRSHHLTFFRACSDFASLARLPFLQTDQIAQRDVSGTRSKNARRQMPNAGSRDAGVVLQAKRRSPSSRPRVVSATCLLGPYPVIHNPGPGICHGPAQDRPGPLARRIETLEIGAATEVANAC